MSGYQMTAESLKLALKAMVEAFPNSFVADLMLIFSEKDVVKFIEIFSGRVVVVPKVDAIYRAYRNKVIIETLSIKNTGDIRKQLGDYFGLPPGRVGMVFYNHRRLSKSARKPNPSVVDNTVSSVYKTQSLKLYKEIEQFLTAEKHKRSTI